MSLLEIQSLRSWVNTPDGVARAVDGVDLTVESGETVGVVGESGSGKTLLALSIVGLLPEPGGHILPGSSLRFRGEELLGDGGKGMRQIRGKGVAMVFQEPMTSLNPVLTAGAQIREALSLHRGMKGKVALEQATRLLKEVGLPDPEIHLEAYPHQLSGGMRQRVMLAMALAGDPELLVADEPTTALDPTIQAQILALLEGVCRRRGMSLLLISHDLGAVAGVCRRVVVLYGGRVMEEGPTREVLTRPLHPYTRGLLRSRPSMESRDALLEPIPGDVPEATAWPRGCRFHPRCAHAWDQCRKGEPELRDVEAPREEGPPAEPGEGEVGARERRARRARCWLVAEEGGHDRE